MSLEDNEAMLDRAINGFNDMAMQFLQFGADLHALAVMIESRAYAENKKPLHRMKVAAQNCRKHLDVFEEGIDDVIAGVVRKHDA
jgi:hypothetical protein